MLRTFDNEQKAKGKRGRLDLFSDPEMEEFFTKGIRGGQSFISQRYAEGENNPETAGNHLLYVDGKEIMLEKKFFCFCLASFSLANNLYGSMETLKLPVSNFEWIPKKDVQKMTSTSIQNIKPQGSVGYAFEVDLQYPDSLHKVIDRIFIFSAFQNWCN